MVETEKSATWYVRDKKNLLPLAGRPQVMIGNLENKWHAEARKVLWLNELSLYRDGDAVNI